MWGHFCLLLNCKNKKRMISENKQLNQETLKVITEVSRFPNNEIGQLIPLSKDSPVSEADIARIVEICDSPSVFDNVFADLEVFQGRRYSEDDARYWVNEMGYKGWDESANFIYILRNSEGQIVAAIDIKSSDLEDAEIGYWASPNDKGWATNMVMQLLDIARESGYQSLSALVSLTNEASANVLLKNGFEDNGIVEQDGGQYKKYVKRFLKS
jgi:RimJ/RimL family protein N-acetyltransferase